jgi:hypothetical protein
VITVFLGTAIGVIIAGAIVAWKLRADASRRASDATADKVVTIPCALRVDGKWKQGKLALNDLAEWRPRFGAKESVSIDTAGTVLLEQRKVAGSEVVALNPQLTVLALNAGGKRVELAVLPVDLPLVSKAFNF